MTIDVDARIPLATLVPGVLARSKVFVIDDTPMNLTLLEKVLATGGVTDIRSFTDPRQGLEACLADRPDIVLVDLHMPDLDGLAFMEALRAALPDGTFLPVVVLTADATTDARRRCLAAGAKDFLTKPYDIPEVLLRVRNLLETGVLYRRLEEHNADLRAELDAQSARERAELAERHARAQRIADVLDGDGLTMVFQPIVDLETGTVVGAEALARFTAEPPQPPNLWFADAAAVGRGTDLELAAIARAVAAIDALPAGAFLSVNASPTTAGSSALLAAIPPAARPRVVVELTEHDRVEDYDALVSALDALRHEGVRAAVDDTGAGYASLEHILRLRADILKLDIALTRGIDEDPVRRSLAAALVTFGNDIGSSIIAEGVETAGELAVLRALGVDWAQGYHLSRPAPPPLPATIEVAP